MILLSTTVLNDIAIDHQFIIIEFNKTSIATQLAVYMHAYI